MKRNYKRRREEKRGEDINSIETNNETLKANTKLEKREEIKNEGEKEA
jgi:hypothetical protein